MKILSLSAAFLISSLLLFSCKKDNPIPPEEQPSPQITLTLEDRSCTEAWIRLTSVNLNLPAEAILKQDESTDQTITLSSSDTLLYVDSLLPNKTYSFIAEISQPAQNIYGDTIRITTMDTTSHNFTFQTWTFGGEAGSCVLYDVAIIDENNIWAVGEIYIADTSAIGYTMYNAMHWNGNEWELKRIKTNACGGVDYPPIEAIFSFASNDIFFAHIDASISHYNGTSYTNDCSLITQLEGAVKKIWGVSNNNFYVVSNNGFIAHYQNGQWTRIESGTELNINDIWGYSDNFGNNLVLCAASDLGTNHQKKLLRINDNSVDTLDWSPQKTLYTIWLPSTHKIYAGGGKTYAKCGNDWIEQTSVNFFTYGIRGNDFNDVYAVGGGHFSHFNGYTWKEISALFLSGGNYEGIATKGGIICSVGYLGNKAIAAIITK